MTLEQLPKRVKSVGLGEDFKSFCSSTSAHGFPYLTNDSKHVKLCWSTILVLALVFGMIHLYTLISQYLKYEYHESIVINTNQVPIFPDVTICGTGLPESSLHR